jgi:hypothetical protein
VSQRLVRVAIRIRNELKRLNEVLERVDEGMRRARRTSDELYWDSVALNLHGFYAGMERLFEMIAGSIDGRMPQGANWHQVLLEQMAAEQPHIRPAVISEETRCALDEYRGFRHVVRNVYSLNFDPVQLQRLGRQAPQVFSQARAELLSFADFLQRHADD